MTIATEFLIDYVNKRVYHDNGTAVYTVNQLYTMLMDAFDEIAAMDDEVPMSAQTPTEYTMINGWFIDDESVKFLKSGAIKTIGYAGNVIQVLTNQAGGWTNLVGTDIGKVIHNGGSTHTGTVLAYNNTTRTVWVRQTLSVFTAEAWTITGGTGAGTATSVASGEDLYSNIYTLGTIADNPSPLVYVQQGESFEENVLSSWWARGHIDVLIKVKSAGVTLNEGNVRVFARQSGDLFDYFQIGLSSGGRNAVPLATSTDLNQTDPDYYMFYDGESAPFTAGLIITGGTSGATAEISAVTDWGTSGFLKLRTVIGTFQDNEAITDTLTGSALVNGTIGSGYLAYDTETGTFTVGSLLTGGISGKTGTIVALQDDGTTGKILVSSPTGTFVDNDTLTDASTGVALANGASITAVSGYLGIKVWFMNSNLNYDTGTVPFSTGETITGATSGATGVVLQTGSTASGTLYLGNRNSTAFVDNEALIGSVTGNFLFYDTETAPFTVGKTLTGGTSSATATITAVNDLGAYGILTLSTITGTFADNEIITDNNSSPGSASVNGTKGTSYLAYDTETAAFTTLGQTITGGTSTATGVLRAIQDNGTTGYLLYSGGNGKLFSAAEIVTGGTEGSASATAVQTIAGAASNGGGYPASTITKAFDQATAKNYKVIIDAGGQPLAEVYEFLKFTCRQGSTYQFFRTEDATLTAAFLDDGGAFTDYTTAANDLGTTGNDINYVPAVPAVNDAFYFGGATTFGKIKLFTGTVAGAATWTLAYEYWNGGSWVTLANIVDNSVKYSVAGSKYLTYDRPTDWATTTVNGVVAYYVRIRVSAFTSITTQPKADYLQLYPPQQPVTGAVYSDAHFGYTPVKASPFGTFAGGKFFGARGIWIQNMASGDIQNYQLTDADNNTQTPPNYQSVTVGNLISGDRVSVFRTTGANNIVDKAMYSASGSVNTSGNGTFVVDGAIAVDTPPTGYLRIRNATTGAEERLAYTSWTGSTFTLSGTLANSYVTDDTAYVPFIDDSVTTTSKSVSVIYAADRNVVIRVRRYAATAILPFETTGTFGSSGLSVSTIRTADTIVG